MCISKLKLEKAEGLKKVKQSRNRRAIGRGFDIKWVKLENEEQCLIFDTRIV